MLERRPPLTTTVTENETKKSLSQSMQRIVNDCDCLKLLRFFGSHPNSRFNKLAVTHAVDENGSKQKIEKALAQLMEEKVVEVNIENDVCLYHLTREDTMRQTVVDLAELDWLQFQSMLRRYQAHSLTIVYA
jgi:hypothetical protein